MSFFLLVSFCVGCTSKDSSEQNHEELNQDDTIINSAGMEFVHIPEGSFLMGTNQNSNKNDENPQHEITISRSFYMSKYPITVADFKKFVSSTSYQTDAERNGGAWVWTKAKKWEQKEDANWKNPYFLQSDKNPVVCVTWNGMMRRHMSIGWKPLMAKITAFPRKLNSNMR